MQAIDFNALKPGKLYTVAGGPGYTIPFGVYKCDRYGVTEGELLPVTNAIEVVHCKDCFHWDERDWCSAFGCFVENGDFYCADGLARSKADHIDSRLSWEASPHNAFFVRCPKCKGGDHIDTKVWNYCPECGEPLKER